MGGNDLPNKGGVHPERIFPEGHSAPPNLIHRAGHLALRTGFFESFEGSIR